MPSKPLRLSTKRLAILLSALVPAAGFALDFQSVAPNAAILYAAPSPDAKKLYVVGRATPFEVMSVSGDWARVRDRDGSLGWIEKRALSAKRTVVVNVSRASIRAKADDNAPVLAETGRDLLLELVEAPANGWAKVRHRDGVVGYIPLKDIWGL